MRELSLHVLDVARNSIEAGAGEIEIKVVENTGEDIFSFSVIDDGPGMEKDLIPLITDPFFTTKEKRKKVGLGLSLLKAAAERCGGSLTIEASPGKGTTVTAVFRHGHVDRAPLGDIPGTITALLTDPGLHGLVYEHEVDGKKFWFSIKELKKMLGKVPVNSPAVLCLVRDYLEEGIKGLYGGVNYEVPRRTGKPA